MAPLRPLLESAEDFRRREAWLIAWNQPREAWRERGAADIAFTLEALGATPDLFARVLALADEITPTYAPAGIHVNGYRFGVGRPDRTGGELLGLYRGVAVIAWTVSVR